MKYPEKKNILINILTRTSNRPIGFQKCYTSIKEQTHKNVRHIVSFDDNVDLWYLENLKVDLVDVSKIKRREPSLLGDSDNRFYAPYNLYCNSMLDIVDNGWILFLDDDDNLYHNRVVEELVSLIKENQSEDYIFIWQMRYPDGRILPTKNQIENQIIKRNNIGSPCFLFHSKYKNSAKWDSFKVSDFRFLQQLLEAIPNHVFIKKVMVQINNYGDFGQRNDLVKKSTSNFSMPKLFYKNPLWFLIPKYHTNLWGYLIFHKSSYNGLLKKVLKKFGISGSKENNIK